MEKIVLLVALVALLGSHASSTKVIQKSLLSHSAILDQFKATVNDFSKSLVLNFKGSDEMQDKLANTINNNLAAQLDKLSVMVNDTTSPGNDICCQCNHCVRGCQACGRSCCCQGDQGCVCVSCSTGAEMIVDAIGMSDSKSTLIMWAETSKMQLKREVTKALATYDDLTNNGNCCICSTCQKRTTGCGNSNCCEKGDDCICKNCLSKNFDMLADSISHPVSLNVDVKAYVEKVDTLIDNLLILLTVS